MEATYKLEDLAKLAGVSPRTVRYYVQRGLLPAPTFRGKDTAYGDDHLARLQAIRKLQEQYLPLDAIQAELERRSAEDVLRTPPAVRVPPPSIPAPMPMPVPSRSWRRYELRDGVEIHLREDVAPSVGNLVNDLAKLFGQKGPYR
jgi:DNA-binding transcriptional MerR regulator